MLLPLLFPHTADATAPAVSVAALHAVTSCVIASCCYA
jgi:hypothetical protein